MSIVVDASVTLRRLERERELTTLEASAAQRDLLDLDILLVDFEPFAARVWELRRTIMSYDAWYVAVAEALEAPLATLDRRLSRASGPRCRFLVPT